MTRAVIAALALALTACTPKIITRTVTVEVPVVTVQRVPAALTRPVTIPNGPLSECPVVAAQRKSAAETCNGQLKAIEERHGE
jgi:hypothetical protein